MNFRLLLLFSLLAISQSQKSRKQQQQQNNQLTYLLCPRGCHCDNVQIVCSRQRFTTTPVNVKSNTVQSFDLRANQIQYIKQNVFNGLKNLKTL